MDKNLNKIVFYSCLAFCVPQLFISFGVQYAEVYIIQHIDTQQKAITSIIGNICGVLAYYLLAMESIINFISRNTRKFIIFEMVSYNIAHLMIPMYPWYAMIAMSLNSHLIAKINEVLFEDLHNKIFKGRDRTILSTKRKMWKMIGVLSGSGLTLIFINVPIDQVVYISLIGDIVLMIMNMVLYQKLK